MTARDGGRPLHLVMVVSSLDASDGGPPQAVLEIARAWVRRGHRATVVSHHHRDDRPHSMVDVATEAGVEVRLVPRRRPTRFQFSPKLLHAARSAAKGADLVSAHGFYQFTCFSALIASRRAGGVLFLQPHGVFEPYQESFSPAVKRWFRRTLGRLVLSGTRTLVAASPSESDGATITLGDATPPVLVAGLGVTAPERSASPHEEDGERRVLFLSRIAPKKRIDKLIDAAALLEERGRPIEVTICGDGDPELVAELQARAEGVRSVHWAGHVSGPERAAIEAGHALFCLPSDNENFGQAVTEAMARGLPVVTTRAVGAAEHVRLAGSGWVLDDPDPVELADVIDAALSDPPDLAVRAERGRVYAEKDLSWEAVAQRWEQRARTFT